MPLKGWQTTEPSDLQAPYEARLASPYPECAASIPNAATPIPCACSCRTGPPTPADRGLEEVSCEPVEARTAAGCLRSDLLAIADRDQHQPARAGSMALLPGDARGLALQPVYDRERVRCRRNASTVASTMTALRSDGSRA
jgi:hypothetical protein